MGKLGGVNGPGGNRLDHILEGWIEAQHNSGMREFPAICNKHADSAATTSLEEAADGVFFLPREFVPGTVYHVAGKYVVDLYLTLDSLYDEHMIHRAGLGLGGWTED